MAGRPFWPSTAGLAVRELGLSASPADVVGWLSLTEQAAEFPPGPLEDAAEAEYVITGNHIDHNRSHVVLVGTLPFFLHDRVLHTTVSWGVPDEELIPSLVLLLWALQWRIMRWSHTP